MNEILESIAKLPELIRETCLEILHRTIDNPNPVRIVMAGPFSTAKSSTVNQIIGIPLLPTGIEETTALPVILQGGSNADRYFLINAENGEIPVTKSEFSSAVVGNSGGIVSAAADLANDDLKGVLLVDLPGLGGSVPDRREYALSQIRQADAVIYALFPKGPAREDLELLGYIQSLGKKVLIIVSKWDEIQDAAFRGEQIPDLGDWANCIANHTGIRQSILPVSAKSDIGRRELIDFISQTKHNFHEIRVRRFLSEIHPLLENAIGQVRNSIKALLAESENRKSEIGAEIISDDLRLRETKERMRREHAIKLETLKENAERINEQMRKQLSEKMMEIQKNINPSDPESCTEFLEEGTKSLSDSLATLASEMHNLFSDYGTIPVFPPEEANSYNLRIPSPEPVEPSDFSDYAVIRNLQEELEDRMRKEATIETEAEGLPDTMANPEDAENLKNLEQRRNELLTMPLPKIVKEISSETGERIGRAIGEIADIFLIVVKPILAGAKAAAIIGKGAKHVGKSAIAKAAATTAVQGAGGSSVLGNAVGMLDMLSLGYWGEKLGRSIGYGACNVESVDPEEKMKIDGEIELLESQIGGLRRKLARIYEQESENRQKKCLLAGIRKEREQIENKIRLSETALAEKIKTEQEKRSCLLAKSVASFIQRTMTHWDRSFARQASGMTALLMQKAKQHWESYVETALEDSTRAIVELKRHLGATHEEKRLELAVAREEERALVSLLEKIKKEFDAV
jgi:hypothetical protein